MTTSTIDSSVLNSRAVRDTFRLRGESNLSAERLIAQISKDPSWRDLTLAVSQAWFSGSAVPFPNLESVTHSMGASWLHCMADTAALSNSFATEKTISIYSRHCLWRHSIAVGLVAQVIARMTASCSPEEAFTAGLFHDIGWLAFDEMQEHRFNRWMEATKDEQPQPETEREMIGKLHSDVGGETLEALGAPSRIVAAVQLHHRPHLANDDQYHTVACMTLANYLVSRLGWTSIGRNNTRPPAGVLLRQLDISTLSLRLLWSRIAGVLEEAAAIADTTLKFQWQDGLATEPA